jgi:hypothetical protein
MHPETTGKEARNMDRKWLLVLLMLAIGLSFGLESRAQEPILMPVEISGFADILWRIDEPDVGAETFALGQAEIDLASTVGDRIDVEVAVAYDPESETFGLGALVADIRLFGESESHFQDVDWIEHGGLVVGQMDVPFGIDWLVYPSIDRKLISGPLAVAGTHDGWGDLGAAFYVENRAGNAVFYFLNGTGYCPPDQDEATIGGDIGNAYGGRAGLTLFSGAEVGASNAVILTRGRDTTSQLWGADAQWASGMLSCKAEFIRQIIGLDADLELTHDGWYVQGMVHPERTFLVARYGSFASGGDSGECVSRVCCGAGLALADQAEIRAEYQAGLDGMKDRILAQIVVGF